MKQIAEIYGKFLLDAVLAVSLLLFVFCGMTDTEGNKGIFAIIGAHLDVTGTEDTVSNEFAVFQEEAKRKPPVILYVDSGMIYTGRHIFSDFIRAEDNEGRELSVRLLGVWKPQEEFEAVLPAVGEVEFSSPGIYRLKVTAKDDRNRRTISVIQIPVNQRRE